MGPLIVVLECTECESLGSVLWLKECSQLANKLANKHAELSCTPSFLTAGLHQEGPEHEGQSSRVTVTAQETFCTS